MVDSTKKPGDSSPESNQDNLIKQIDELETILARKKAEAQKSREQQEVLPRFNVGTDGIPVLVEAVTEEGLSSDINSSSSATKQDDQMINDIIDKIDKEITEDLDELILLLKDSIIDEV
ncbi:MAG: hypothetical protein AAF419_02765, partial [Pseudomonadota bacterium]